MTDTEDMTDETHTAKASMDPHAPAHGHESDGEPLGEVDLRSWAAAIGGGAIGLAVAVALFVAASGVTGS